MLQPHRPPARPAGRGDRRRLATRSACSTRSSTIPTSEMLGVEAAGHGLDKQHAASLAGGSPGILHGNKTYLLQDEDGQITEAHSISAGLDYPGIGPEHTWLKEIGRVEYTARTDTEALDAFQLLCRTEGIIPALEPSHAIAASRKRAREMPQDADHPRQPVRPRRQGHLHRGRGAGSGDVSDAPRLPPSPRAAPRSSASSPPATARRHAGQSRRAGRGRRGRDRAGHAVHRSDGRRPGDPGGQPAQPRRGHDHRRHPAIAARFPRRATRDVPLVLMGYANPMIRRGPEWFAARVRRRRRRRRDLRRHPARGGRRARPRAARRRASHLIRLATPTTDAARLPAVLDGSSGFLYYVSVAGITGKQQARAGIDRGRGRAAQGARPTCRSRSASACARPSRPPRSPGSPTAWSSARRWSSWSAQHGAERRRATCAR